MGDFARLAVWQNAHKLALETYHCTSSFPASERFGLTSQARRAAVSIATNIAEGCGRDRDAELAFFLRVALGSANELEYLVYLAGELGLLPDGVHQQLRNDVKQVKRMLAGFIKRVQPGHVAHRRSPIHDSS